MDQEIKDGTPSEASGGAAAPTAPEYPLRVVVHSQDYGGRFDGKEIRVRRGAHPRSGGRPESFGGFDYDDLYYSERDDLIDTDYTWRPDELEFLDAPAPVPGLPSSDPLPSDLMDKIREYAAMANGGIPEGDNMEDAYYSGRCDGKRDLAFLILKAVKLTKYEARHAQP